MYNLFFIYFLFFIFSLQPASLLGFALTLSDWGDIVRREIGQEETPANADYRRAAVRSLAILTAVFLFGFSLEFTRGDDAWLFLESMAVMTGAEAGFVTGYLVALRCYDSQQ